MSLRTLSQFEPQRLPSCGLASARARELPCPRRANVAHVGMAPPAITTSWWPRWTLRGRRQRLDRYRRARRDAVMLSMSRGLIASTSAREVEPVERGIDSVTQSVTFAGELPALSAPSPRPWRDRRCATVFCATRPLRKGVCGDSATTAMRITSDDSAKALPPPKTKRTATSTSNNGYGLGCCTMRPALLPALLQVLVSFAARASIVDPIACVLVFWRFRRWRAARASQCDIAVRAFVRRR
jgi:hypothetical protein